MKLALHIGTANTGTATLQAWFAENREALGAQGVWYPRSPGMENHRRLMVYACDTDKPDGNFARLGVRTPADHDAFRAQLRWDIERELETSQRADDRIWVMSSELLHSKISSPGMITRLRDLLDPLFDEITIYLHLRPQIDLLVANSSQRARMGRAVTRADLTRNAVGPGSSYFNYNKNVSHWEGVFGADRISVLPYRRVPDMLGHLTGLLQLDMSRLTPVDRAERPLDWRTIALANTVNAGFAALNLGTTPDFHLDGMPGDDQLQLGRNLAQEIQARFNVSNGKLADRRSDITLDDLTPDWSLYPEESNLSLLEAPCLFADQLTHMVRRFAQDRAMERWRRHIAEGHLAALTGDDEALARAKRAATEAASELDALGMSVLDIPGLAPAPAAADGLEAS